MTDPTLGEIRALATLHVEKSSLRKVAPQIGITRGALHGLIRGRTPHARIWAKLLTWYHGLPLGAVEDDARYRDIPAAELRAWVVARLEHEGFREIGADIGLHHSTVEAFVKRIERPSIRLRRAVAIRYLADQDND